MVRLWKLAPVPTRLRRAVRAWLDARYVTRVDHRHDIRDSLWEVQALGRELVALRREVERLRAQVTTLTERPRAAAAPDPRQTARWDEAHRLAHETATAVDRLLQNEVLLWQAVDRIDAGARPAGEGAR
ncbi:hypothetical protein Misp01_12990 [Microtetraspora sp. NBRC 13810]|uniref:hypothetical protein n=1 Tax=Microtetraspora sp. NBRC 13810 TaxID=3030990 RepID=UPI00249FE4CF|nr:hypothetical protein [Microtetraspora sp. NBRC 13810]GLW06169.1 hypothetical protein Misp01_12990 [Microtetraspora sp. NBRC 13810]